MNERRASGTPRASRPVRALAGLSALLAGIAAALAAPAYAAPTWSVVASATPTSPARVTLADVACVSDTSCFGVGSYVNAAGVHQMIEHWNGTAWSIVPYAHPVGHLRGIACPNATFCIAVGAQSSGVGAARWNGTTWTATPMANPGAGAFMSDVACSSGTDCFAVGGRNASTTTTVIEHWDGSAWSVVASPNGPNQNSSLSDVACASASFCVAVGSSYETFSDPVIEQWDGMSWSRITTPEMDSDRSLNAVTCTSATTCVAAGFDASTGSTLIKRFDGSMWTDETSPNVPDPSAANVFFDVACSTGTNCFAVGIAFVNGTAVTGILEQWNGMSWSLVPNPATSPAITGYAGVTCPTATTCVTPADRGSGAQLLERWNGTSWAGAGSPVDPTASNAVLADVACATTTTCFGVGAQTAGQFPDTTTRTLVERTTGSSWSVVSSPNRAGEEENSLHSVSCPAANTCFAVGWYGSGGAWRTLVERWNGQSWLTVPSPNVSKSSKFVTPNRLNGVSCSSTTNCFAVGTWYYNGAHTLVLRWDGKTWKVAASPNRTSGENTLSDVSCASAKNCVAVGRTSPNNSGQAGNYSTLAEHWNGNAWSIVATPNGPNARGELAGVSCPSGNVCIAVGSSYRNATRSTLYRALERNDVEAHVQRRTGGQDAQHAQRRVVQERDRVRGRGQRGRQLVAEPGAREDALGRQLVDHTEREPRRRACERAERRVVPVDPVLRRRQLRHRRLATNTRRAFFLAARTGMLGYDARSNARP